MDDVSMYIMADMRYRRRKHKAVLGWLKNNENDCYRCVGDMLVSMERRDCILYIEKQIRLLENEIEKVKLMKAISS